jgi:hypothetical protein
LSATDQELRGFGGDLNLFAMLSGVAMLVISQPATFANHDLNSHILPAS